MIKISMIHTGLLAGCAALLALPALAGELSVTVDGLGSAEGKVMLALFDSASEFPKGKLKNAQMTPAAKGKVEFVFKDLAPGRYALSAYHDLNGNQRLDANMVGMPTEPYGFSRDARGQLGPPRFEDAAFVLGAEPLHLTIHVK
jgi:uncharacterized protein (DUF2141 family)